MSTEYQLTTPLTDEDIVQLKAGDTVKLTGVIYSARDAAHKRIMADIESGKGAPFEIKGAAVYYVGPSPAPPGKPIGAAGPTTSYRMDTYAPELHAMGLKASIGKGKRSEEVKQALKDHKCVYFGATGGAGALLSQRIEKSEVIAYEDLGPEAVRAMTVKDFPLLVVNDCHGNELYAQPKLDEALNQG